MGKRRLRIIVEGVTGSGKTTMANMIKRFLAENGVPNHIDPGELMDVPPACELANYDFFDRVDVETHNIAVLEDLTRVSGKCVNLRLNVDAARDMIAQFGEESAMRDLESAVVGMLRRELPKPKRECSYEGCYREATFVQRKISADGTGLTVETSFCEHHKRFAR